VPSAWEVAHARSKPRRFLLATHDKPILEQIARSRTLPWFQVQRARVVLAIAEGARVQTVAFQMQCDPSTVWRLCRRYEEAGLEGALAEVPRTGHPIEISPPATCPDCAIGVSGTDR
jgi:Winged helix-turn helix